MGAQGLIQAIFLLIAFTAAGGLHLLWLRSARSRDFAWPVDAGLRIRGRRLFGDNKRLCGFMVLPPAAALLFAILAEGREALPDVLGQALWTLSTAGYAWLGLVCGLAFMLAELPNSFLKRQLDIPPGQAPARGWARRLVMLLDRLDSVLGVLLALSLMVPVTAATLLWLLLLGPGVHALFSLAMYRLGIKARAL